MAAIVENAPLQTEKLNSTVDGDDVIETNWAESINSFDSMGLKDELLRGIYAYGFERPSVIQQRAIRPVILEKDVIAQAQSGESTCGNLFILYVCI